MLVGHGERDAVDVRARLDAARAHRVERLLRGEALVHGEGLEQRLASFRVREVPVGGSASCTAIRL